MHEQVIIGEQVAGRAAKVRWQLLDLSADVKSSTFDLAELLFEAQEEASGHAYLVHYKFQRRTHGKEVN